MILFPSGEKAAEFSKTNEEVAKTPSTVVAGRAGSNSAAVARHNELKEQANQQATESKYYAAKAAVMDELNGNSASESKHVQAAKNLAYTVNAQSQGKSDQKGVDAAFSDMASVGKGGEAENANNHNKTRTPGVVTPEDKQYARNQGPEQRISNRFDR